MYFFGIDACMETFATLIKFMTSMNRQHLMQSNGPSYSNTVIGKGKGLDTCYSAAYMSQTRDQQRFTILEVAADWHELMVLQRIMWPFTARANGQLKPRCS